MTKEEIKRVLDEKISSFQMFDDSDTIVGKDSACNELLKLSLKDKIETVAKIQKTLDQEGIIMADMLLSDLINNLQFQLTALEKEA